MKYNFERKKRGGGNKKRPVLHMHNRRERMAKVKGYIKTWRVGVQDTGDVLTKEEEDKEEEGG